MKPDQNSFMEDNRSERFDSWTSYSDMFCSLLMVFMLLFFYAMIQYSLSSLNDATRISELQAEHEQRSGRLQQSLTQLQATLETTELELGIAQADLVAGQVRIDELDSENRSLQTELQEMDGIILQKNDEISALQTELADALSTGEMLRNELSASWSKQAVGEEKITALEDDAAAQIEALKAQIDAFSKQNNINPAAEITALKAEISRLEAELASRQQQLDEMDVLYRTSQTQEQAASAALETMQTRLNDLQLQNAELTTENSTLDSNILALNAEVERMLGQINSQAAALENIAGIRTEIISKVSEMLRRNDVMAYVDTGDGTITLDSQLLFQVNGTELSTEGKAFLQKFFPLYFEALMSPEARSYIAQIVVEGHTDTTGSYLSNLDLSLRRAQAVAEYCIGLFEDEQQLQLTQLICASGCSYSDPVLMEDGSVDMQGSRRVEIKFSLKDEYMMEKIRDIIEE